MVDRLSTLLYGLMFFTFLVLTGCPPPSTTKPEMPSSPPPSQTSVKEQPAKAAPKPAPLTSLELQRQGKAPVTPASSPLKDIHYNFDSYDLRGDARETLKANVGWLKANPSARVEIEGHCDERGTNEYNLALGAQRAQAAKDYLVSLGVSAGRLSTISYGEELPVCKEKTEECWQTNRRARFVITTARPAS
ncbi:MAG: peptidoglycan-associated lipoprotein Pal [Deltaproteobacteria bacterium]|nr:peptidoglycan-associated lipoprotein Pal [Deltaproteobacteria bacterium]